MCGFETNRLAIYAAPIISAPVEETTLQRAIMYKPKTIHAQKKKYEEKKSAPNIWRLATPGADVKVACVYVTVLDPSAELVTLGRSDGVARCPMPMFALQMSALQDWPKDVGRCRMDAFRDSSAVPPALAR